MLCYLCVCVALFLHFWFGLVFVLFDCFRALENLSLELLARPVGYMPRDAGDQQMQKTCLGTRPTQRKAELTTRERGSRGGERERERDQILMSSFDHWKPTIIIYFSVKPATGSSLFSLNYLSQFAVSSNLNSPV